MKPCGACGEHTMIHSHGAWVCLSCQFEDGSRLTMHKEKRYKKVLRSLDKIGARLAGLR